MVKVSIIIPVYKVEKYIERCLRSVMAQRYDGPVECILVDDCTPDRSMEIARQVLSAYSGNIDFKMVRHEENRGLSAARNTGIREATGEYLYFLDSDDAISENCMKILIDVAEKCDPDFVVGEVNVIGKDSNIITRCLGINHLKYLEGHKSICRSYGQLKWYPMGWNKLISRNFLLSNELFFEPGIYYEDELWSYRLATIAYKMVICPEVTYLYYKREGSIMGSFKEKHIHDALFIIQKMVDILHDKPNKWMGVKLRNISLFFVFRLLDSQFSKTIKTETFKRLKVILGVDVRWAYPLSLKDALRSVPFILPSQLGLFYMRLLKQIIS